MVSTKLVDGSIVVVITVDVHVGWLWFGRRRAAELLAAASLLTFRRNNVQTQRNQPTNINIMHCEWSLHVPTIILHRHVQFTILLLCFDQIFFCIIETYSWL